MTRLSRVPLTNRSVVKPRRKSPRSCSHSPDAAGHQGSVVDRRWRAVGHVGSRLGDLSRPMGMVGCFVDRLGERGFGVNPNDLVANHMAVHAVRRPGGGPGIAAAAGWSAAGVTSATGGATARVTSSACRLATGIATTAGGPTAGSGSDTASTAPGVAACIARGVAAVSPKATESLEDGSTFPARLAVVVATAIARVTAVRWMVDPGVDIELAAALARSAPVARIHRDRAAACIASAGAARSRADATAGHPGDGEAENGSGQSVCQQHDHGPCVTCLGEQDRYRRRSRQS